MKYLGLILGAIFLTSCNNSTEGTITLDQIDLTGTWLLSTEERSYKTSTDEYLSSTYYNESFILEETNNGVAYLPCHFFGNLPPNYGFKASDHFYFFPSDNGFTLKSTNELEQVKEFTNVGNPEFYYKSISRLKKKSDDIRIDNGTLILKGPVSIEEYNHICIWEVSFSTGITKSIEITTPYDDLYLSLRLDIHEEIYAGTTYQYQSANDSSPVKIDVTSNSTQFNDIVGTNLLQPKDVSINIIEYDDIKISGTFSFTSFNNESYSGEFEASFDQ
jgi:hypothetical protein